MNRCFALMHRALVCAAVVLPLAAPLSANADPVSLDVLFDGSGSLNFDSVANTGVWMGTLVDLGFAPAPPSLPALTSQVSFSLSGTALSGMFAFSDGAANTLTGLLDGTLASGSFADGGQLLIDYTVDGGTGLFSGATGFAISILDFLAPVNGSRAYTEVATGVLVVQQVPEPAGLTLAGVALLALLATRRKVAPLN